MTQSRQLTTLEELVSLPECCYRISVKALIHDDEGKVLVVKEGDDYWDLPGGGTEHNEGFAVSLRREVEEEVGLTIEVGKLYDCVKFVSVDGIHAVFQVYECQVISGAPTAGEADELAWMPISELNIWPLNLMIGFGAETK